MLGLGPIWMSRNEAVKQRTARALEDGGIFAFGLSEKAHGADIYSTDMTLTPVGEGRYLANGRKYYIGNGNEAAIVSTFGKLGGRGTGSGDYVFFAADPRHERYELVQNVVASQNFVSEFALHDYPVSEADILHQGPGRLGRRAQHRQHRQVQPRLGVDRHLHARPLRGASTHAANRRLYDMRVTDFAHVRRMFVDAYARLVAMKLFALRAADYMRSASAEDRRYLLYNPMVKMKVTTQGEEVINLLWDAIAAKGFEKDMYFEQAAIDIRGAAEARGHGAREHRADREVHAELLLRAGRAARGPTPRRRRQRRLPLRAGPGARARRDPLPRLPHGLRRRGTSPTSRCSPSRSRCSASCSRARPRTRRS